MQRYGRAGSLEATMSSTMLNQEAVPRNDAIVLLRNEMLKLTDDESSICKVAAERGIFCQGFHRYTDGSLRRCYSWLDKRHPGLSRPRAGGPCHRWQLARQEVDQVPLACDVQQKEHDSCGGWDDFSNEALSRFYLELTGRALVIA
jgi:hypothetical protein